MYKCNYIIKNFQEQPQLPSLAKFTDPISRNFWSGSVLQQDKIAALSIKVLLVLDL